MLSCSIRRPARAGTPSCGRFPARNPPQSRLLRSFPDRFVNRFGTDRLLSSGVLPANGLARPSRRKMPDRNLPDPGGPLRRVSPAVVVIAFALVMTACVLGVVVWKALEAKATTLATRPNRHPEPRALAGRACRPYHPVGRYRDGRNGRLAEVSGPVPERFNRYLAETANSLPQIREIGVLDAEGNWAIRRCRKHPGITIPTAATSPIIVRHREARSASTSPCNRA